MFTLALLLTTAAHADDFCTGGGGDWTEPSIWFAGDVPGAGEVAGIINSCSITYNLAADNGIGAINMNSSGELVLDKPLEVIGNFDIRDSRVDPQGHDITVGGDLTNYAHALGFAGGEVVRSGGSVTVGGDLSLGRDAANINFRPGDHIGGSYLTTISFDSAPTFNVTQDPEFYGDALGSGLTVMGGLDLAVLDDLMATVTLDWDGGLDLDDSGFDWTLRVGGDQAAALQDYHAAGQLIIGATPDGEVFDPAANIVYDAASDTTYVGFEEWPYGTCVSRVGIWSDPASWDEGLVPDDNNEGRVYIGCDMLYDIAAPDVIERVWVSSGDLTLAKPMTVLDSLNVRDGTFTDGGHDVQVGGELSNGNYASGRFEGSLVREGGTLTVDGRASFGRAAGELGLNFRPGDTIGGDLRMDQEVSTVPHITVAQDPVFYGDALGGGLSLGGVLDLDLAADGSPATITLEWDGGYTPDATGFDWTLRLAGDQVGAVVAAYDGGHIVIGSLPDGRSFDPAAHIVYDADTDMTYVGFSDPAAQAVVNPDGTLGLSISGLPAGARLRFFGSTDVDPDGYGCDPFWLQGCLYHVGHRAAWGEYSRIYASPDGTWERTFEVPESVNWVMPYYLHEDGRWRDLGYHPAR